MKLFGDNNMLTNRVGNFSFSGVRPEKLGATEYTLVTVVTDKTGSVAGFEKDLVAMKRAVVQACQRDPRAEFLMLRNVWFNTKIDEEHGFVELAAIDPAKYSAPKCDGMTALHDAVFSSVAVSNAYAKTLRDSDFSVNAVVFIITDGEDNKSSHTVADVKAELARGVRQEHLESLNVILIGVNAVQCRARLETFQRQAGLTQYVDAGTASPKQLAQLAGFVAKSISSQSKSLGSGGPSKALVF